MSSSTIHHQVTAIEITAGTPAGGGQDRAARALAEAISAASGIDAMVTNVVGRGGGVAWETAMRRPADGSHVAISSPTLVTNSLHDPDEIGLDDLTHLAILYAEPLVFIVSQDAPISGAQDLISQMQREPEAVNAAIATAIGNVNHLSVAAIAQHAGISARSLAVIAFGSARDAVENVIDGAATFAVVSAASAIDGVHAKQVRPIAVSASTRTGPPFDAVPLLTEIGIDCEFATWRGVVGPPRMGDEVVRRLEATLAAAVETDEWLAAIERHMWIPSFSRSDEATRFVRREREHAERALRDLGLVDG